MLQFVNIHGETVATTAAPPVKRRVAAVAQAQHKGWLVVGYSPAVLVEARRAHEKQAPTEPFDEANYMRTHKPVRVRSAPYELHQAARECADLAERHGWQGVQVVARVQGGQA